MGYKKNLITHSNLYDRVQKLLVSFEWSDCAFSIYGKKFRAHKLILGIGSPVFEAMFYGPLSTNEDVVITDIEPDIFQLLLNYIYTDKVEISSIEEAFELLYSSKKYLLEHLSELCIAYINANISIDNVTTILNYPDFMQDKELVSAALKLFCEHANHLLQENKKIITSSCMKTILESSQMNIIEKDLIKYVFDWTILHCEQSNAHKMFENARDFLINNGLFKLLRFFTLSINGLDEIVTDKNNLLLPCEEESIRKVIKGFRNIDNSEIFGTMLTPRSSLILQWYLCHRSPLRSAAPIIIDSTNFQVNCRVKAYKSIFITSLCIPTRMAPILNFRTNSAKVYSEQISISVVCESDNSIIKFTNFMNIVEYDSNVDIELSEPCLIKKDKWYKINFLWPQNRYLTYSYVAEYRDRVYTDHKVKLEFEDSFSTTGNGGSFLGGLKFCL